MKPVITCNHHGSCGCEVSSCCLNCPLAQCRYESEGGVRGIRNRERNPKIKALEGILPVAAVAELFEMSQTNVNRIWAAPQMGIDNVQTDMVT